MGHTRFINNWDLVDSSAPHIVGDYLAGRSKKPLYDLAGSGDLWERRIAVMATFQFIKRDQVVRDLEGNVISEGMVEHVYLIEDGLIKSMEIREA